MPTLPNMELPVVWHILAETSVPVAEFSLALSELVPVISWIPEMSFAGLIRHRVRRELSKNESALKKFYFPLQRGYARFPVRLGASTFRKVSAMLLSQTTEPEQSVLVCTSSFWARTAALWPGPVVFYVTDLTAAYAGLSRKSVIAADRTMCGIADLVCPNSPRLSDYLSRDADCASAKIVVIPNATRAANIRTERFDERDDLPADALGLSRPVAGVIGNMGDNIDWELVWSALEAVPEYKWLFVGPAPGAMLSRRNKSARADVMRSPRALFLGTRSYADLFRYARAFDVAVMPYKRIEPTFSGSSTRFYEHLAAGRPLLSTRGVEELLHKEPLLTLVDSAEELASELRRLLVRPADQLEMMRCKASRSETWENRAANMLQVLLEKSA